MPLEMISVVRKQLRLEKERSQLQCSIVIRLYVCVHSDKCCLTHFWSMPYVRICDKKKGRQRWMLVIEVYKGGDSTASTLSYRLTPSKHVYRLDICVICCKTYITSIMYDVNGAASMRAELLTRINVYLNRLGAMVRTSWDRWCEAYGCIDKINSAQITMGSVCCTTRWPLYKNRILNLKKNLFIMKTVKRQCNNQCHTTYITSV